MTMARTDSIGAGGAVVAASGADTAEIVDVWSRTGRKYRLRAIVLLGINVVLFAGLGSFAFWLRSGVRFAPTMEGYWDQIGLTFNFYGQTGVSLAALLLDPISVQDVPMQIPILGLLMAALIAIPILVAILYRFWACLPFLAVVSFLAVMPWLGITLLGSCILASIRPFRARFRFVSALIGLIPAVVYFVMAWSGGGEAIVGVIDPVDKIKFMAPWVLAIVAAALLFAVVLLIAKMVDYRPGAITPLLALMFGLPVGLFEAHVGRDELYYRLLVSLNEDHFSDRDASVGLKLAADLSGRRRAPSSRNLRAERERAEQVWQFALADDIAGFRSVLTGYQAELVDRCDRFLKFFPRSRYAANVLFIKARALDMRIDPAEFRRTKWIRFYDGYPGIASRQAWEAVTVNRPDSLLAAVGHLRLAVVEARDGRVERARDHVDRTIAFLEHGATGETSARPARSLSGVFTAEAAVTSLEIDVEQVRIEAYRLHGLLAANRDPIYGWDPIAGTRRDRAVIPFGLLDLVPRDEHYAANLRRLKEAYPKCQIKDNIDLELAKAAGLPGEKIERLESLLQEHPRGDAVPEALYRLGVAYYASDRADEGYRRFARLSRVYPRTIWAEQALRYSPRNAVMDTGRATP